MRDPFDFATGDLRTLARQLGVKATESVRGRIEQIVREEAEVTADRLRERVSAIETGGKYVARRSGKFARTVSSRVKRSPFTVAAEVGFLNPRTPLDTIKAYMHTRMGAEEAETVITPKKRQMLAIPVRGVSPRAIIDARGQHMTPKQAMHFWDVIKFTSKAILGKMKGQRAWTFLFRRARFVTVPKRIDLDKEADRMTNRILRRFEREL